jgi:hypothetical protein
VNAGVDTWELRWIGTRFPERFGVEALSRSLGVPSRAVEEHDVYLLTGDPHINLKVRHREGTLKLKVLQETAQDGLERWETRLDAWLPAGTGPFSEVLRLLGCDGNAGRLGGAAEVEEVIRQLAAILEPGRLVAMTKARQLLKQETCRLDLVRFQVGDHVGVSLGIESSRESDLRRLVGRLALRTLGVPQSYMDYLYRPNLPE